MMAVPQSGPMTMSPRASAWRLSVTSSASATLSEKSMTLRPRFTAFSASAAAYSPGTEISASPARASASAMAMLRGARFWPGARSPASSLSPRSDSSLCASASAASTAAGSPSTMISRSLGPACTPLTSVPASRSRSRLAGVAMLAEALLTPGRRASFEASCISVTESR
jgi:hypothetical protein